MTQHIISSCTVVHYTVRYHTHTGLGLPLSVLLAQAWHVFNKPLEPECKMKSPGCNFKDSSVFLLLTQEPLFLSVTPAKRLARQALVARGDG